MTTTVNPHPFEPLHWWDRLHRHGRCRACIVPKQGHPAPLWMDARAVGDERYHSPESVLASALRSVKAATPKVDP